MFSYHVYVGVPTPPVVRTVKGVDIVPLSHIIFNGLGCVTIEGSGSTIIVIILELTSLHPPDEKDTLQ